MNYIGSKYSLLEDIGKLLDEHHVPSEGIALDLFAGTGAVAQLLKLRGYTVYANDWQYYSYVTNIAFIGHNTLPTFGKLLEDKFWREQIWSVKTKSRIMTYSIVNRRSLDDDLPSAKVLSYLNQIPGSQGAFYEAYCDGGSAKRIYYSRENGLRIQAIRDTIATWSNNALISTKERAWLIACLIEAADRVANTASVYGAYLKHIKRSAQKPLKLVALDPIASPYPAEKHRVFCKDGYEVLKRLGAEKLRLIYIDPPYNHRQYSANYHILETIARWDVNQFEPRGITGLRTLDHLRSDYCVKNTVERAFRQLFERANSEYLLFSYNNEGLLTEDKLLNLFDEFCVDVRFTRIEYNRFRADIDRENRVYKADHTHEYLILGKRKTWEQLSLL